MSVQVVGEVFMFSVVIRAANVLQVDELEVFRLAHRFWNRQCDEPSYIGRAFSKYLQEKVAPPWVNHFARRVLQSYQSKNFDPAAFGVYPCYERLPLIWSLALQTPRYVPLKRACDVFVA